MMDKSKSGGVVRRVDELGRITLLKEDRDILGIETGTQVEIYRNGKEIIIRKYRGMCEICEKQLKDKNVEIIGDKFICKNCIEKIKDMDINR